MVSRNTPSQFQVLKQTLKERGDRLLLLHESRSITCCQFVELWDLASESLAFHRVEPYQPVGVVSDWSQEQLAFLFALAENRNIMVPISTSNPAAVEHRFVAAACRVTWNPQQGLASSNQKQSLPDLYKNLVERKESGLVLFSSGSTGQPKGMLHAFDRLLQARPPARQLKSLRQLLFLYPDHIGGIDTLLRALANGSTLVTTKNREPETVAAAIQDNQVEVLSTTPTFLGLLLIKGLPEKYNLSSLKIIAYGAERMPEPLLERLRASMPWVDFQEKFGTSETGALTIRATDENSRFFEISEPGSQTKVVDGELWIKSETSILGYLEEQENKSWKDGWFRSGDLVETLPNGAVRIVGRVAERINVGGQKVLPGEVESCLLTHPNVQHAHVYGESNAFSGQWIVAEVVQKKDTDPDELKEQLRQLCHERLETYKVPGKIRIKKQIRYSERFKKQKS